MPIQVTAFPLPLFIATIISAILAGLIWRRRPGPGVIAFVLLMLGVAEWTLFGGLQLMVSDLVWMGYFAGAQYIGITLVPVAWFAFVLGYTHRQKWLTKGRIALLAVEPILVIMTILTNGAHQLFWVERTLGQAGSLIVQDVVYGPVFWFHAVYSYVLLLAGTILLIQAMIRSPQLYRGQVAFLLLGALVPWVANIVYLTGTNPIPQIDLTPFAFTLTGLFAGYSLYRFRLLDIIPVARESVMESISDAIVVLDTRNRVVDVNPVALAILGQSENEVMGRALEDLMPEQKALMDEYRDTPQTRTELSIPMTEGLRIFDLSISPLRTRQGDLQGRLLILRDITDQKEAEAKLQEFAERLQAKNEALIHSNADLEKARMEAEAASRLKSEFLATMSHELRTPMNAIIGYTQLQLQGIAGVLTDEQTDYQERILTNASNLLQLINNILDLSKIEAGRTELVERDMDLKGLFDDIEKQTAGLAQAKNLTYTIHVDPSLPSRIHGDPTRLKQIIINLASNAIKFTDSGSVEIAATTYGKEKWRLQVTDTGIGIPSHALEYIFEEFRQVDGTSERKHGGTGLGLAIVRKLVVMMGGTVQASSTSGEGSNFTILLPLVQVTEE